MCSWNKQLPNVIGIGPQWATTNVRQKATVVCEVRGSQSILIHSASVTTTAALIATEEEEEEEESDPLSGITFAHPPFRSFESATVKLIYFSTICYEVPGWRRYCTY